MSDSQIRTLRVAVIGSGPSGVFATEALLKSQYQVKVDLFERLPTPYGLVRYGVAPDHLTIKTVTKSFERALLDERVRFFGNVEFGKDITYAELKEYYDAIIYTVGASADRRLGIPGEDLQGSLSATEFVAWYNGHPDAAERDIILAKGVAVVGVGNVALDVSRILLKNATELHESDIATHALERLSQHSVSDVWILGRRGAAQAAFTTKELREFGELAEAEPVVIAEEIAVSEEEKALLDPIKKNNIQVLNDFVQRPQQGKEKRVHLRFLVSPVEIIDDGTGRVCGLKIEKNRLDEQGRACGTGVYEVLPVQMVLRSVGYRGVPLADVPFDDERGIIPTEGGRVSGRVGEYAAGWIKRGPSGVVGTNRKDATETVATLLEDVAAGLLTTPPKEADLLPELLESRGITVFTWQDWQALDAYELSQGKEQGRPRVKVVQRAQMLGHHRKN